MGRHKDYRRNLRTDFASLLANYPDICIISYPQSTVMSREMPHMGFQPQYFFFPFSKTFEEGREEEQLSLHVHRYIKQIARRARVPGAGILARPGITLIVKQCHYRESTPPARAKVFSTAREDTRMSKGSTLVLGAYYYTLTVDNIDELGQVQSIFPDISGVVRGDFKLPNIDWADFLYYLLTLIIPSRDINWYVPLPT